MGQKVNPVGFRLGVNRGWDSVWYAKKKDFGNFLIEDFKININKKGEFLSGKIISAKQIGLGIPVLDKNNEAAKEIKRLTNLDFPNSDLKINDFGEISLNN